MRYLPAFLTLIMLVVLIALGIWQLQRLSWKRDILARIDAQRNAPPIAIRTQSDLRALAKLNDYAPVRLYGKYSDAPTHFWFAQIANPPANLPRQDHIGYHALNLFLLTDGTPIAIDRGFLPARLKESLAPPPLTARTITAILRYPSPRGIFDPPDAPQENLWYVRDPKSIGAQWNVALPPFLFEASERNNAFPLGGQTRYKLSNNHLQYAVTWFSLAGVLALISGLWHILQTRQA